MLFFHKFVLDKDGHYILIKNPLYLSWTRMGIECQMISKLHIFSVRIKLGFSFILNFHKFVLDKDGHYILIKNPLYLSWTRMGIECQMISKLHIFSVRIKLGFSFILNFLECVTDKKSQHIDFSGIATEAVRHFWRESCSDQTCWLTSLLDWFYFVILSI